MYIGCSKQLWTFFPSGRYFRGPFFRIRFIIAGDFNTDLDSSDPVAMCINKFLVDFSLLRCDTIFPLRKCVTYVNESLGHESCIDYVLVSDVREVLDLEITAPEINFSEDRKSVV